MSDTACKYCGTELVFTSLGEVCPNDLCSYADGFYFGPRAPKPAPERTFTAAEVAELKAPMECGHPRACETFDGLVRDKEGRVHRCAICVELSTLKAQCAAKIQDIVTLFAKVKASCPEDNSFGSAQRLGITVCIEIAESSIPTDYAAALAEHDEQLRQTFSKECARFHEEGRKCATCGREDIAELKAQCAAMLHQAVQLVRENQSRHDSNELNWPQTFDQIEHELCALIPTDHADALAEHYQRSREQGWQEAIKLIQTGTKSYQGQWPTALRDALAEVKRQARELALGPIEVFTDQLECVCETTVGPCVKHRLITLLRAALRAEGAKQP